MAARNKPYEQFGPFVIFKKLESDALGDLWRAAKIENGTLGPLVALRRLTGGDRNALVASATAARQIVPLLTGTSFVRDQSIDVIDGTPAISHEYAGGRSLRHVVSRARGGTGNTPNPIPIDQAIAIAERVALSLATTADLRHGGDRLLHGGLIPQFVWISDDGEIRVAGQQLGRGLVASLGNGAVGAEIGRYFAPEYQTSGEPSKASEVYSLGALLYLLVTGHEPPDPTAAGAFSLAVRGAKTPAGTAVPDDIRSILEKSLVIDPAARYATVADMKMAVSSVANSGRYGATTFNLAFYLSNLLKKEMESEAIDRERESKLSLAPYLEAPPTPVPVAATAAAPPPATYTPSPFAGFGVEQPKKSRMPLIAAAVVLVAGAGIGAWMMFGSKKDAAATAAGAGAPPQTASRAEIAIPEPIVASASTTAATGTAAATATTASTSPAADEAARKKAFEDAVKQKLQREMMKLQAEYTRQLQQQQSRNAPILSSTPSPGPATASVAEERGPSAAELDSQRREAAARAQEAAATQTVAQTVTQQPAPAVVTTQAAVPPPPAPAVQVPTVREGDIVDLAAVDVQPRVVREARPVYPPVAARQKIVASVLATILISEKGDVIEVKILRGDARFGFNDAATRALRGARYTPAMKDGKRVKTWWPQIIQFNP